MALPTNVTAGQDGHADLHNDVNAEVNTLTEQISTKVGSTNSSVLNIVKLTQAEYDALEAPSATTMYVIVGA